MTTCNARTCLAATRTTPACRTAARYTVAAFYPPLPPDRQTPYLRNAAFTCFRAPAAFLYYRPPCSTGQLLQPFTVCIMLPTIIILPVVEPRTCWLSCSPWTVHGRHFDG